MLQHIYDGISPIAFSIGSIDVYWYGILFVLSFFIGALILLRVAKRWQLDFTSDDLLTILLIAIVCIVICARAAYVIFYGDGYYARYPGKIFAVNEGGLSFHGGLVGGVLAAFICSRLLKMPLLSILDLALIVAPLGICFVRCANFINGELWGAVTEASWGVVFGGTAGNEARHPSQLYEAALEGIVLFVIQMVLARKLPPRPRGTFTGVFLCCYAVFRILVEFVRQPDIQVGYLFGTDWITMGMTLSVPLLIAGVLIFLFAQKKKLPQQGHGRDIFGGDKSKH